MPDLTGRSLEQIEDALHRGKFSPADFPKRRDDEAGQADDREPQGADTDERFSKDGDREQVAVDGAASRPVRR
jgi:hypothetical protein